MPFSDDVSLSSLPGGSADLFLVDVFANPSRCRFSQMGRAIVDRYGTNLAGAFADEIKGASTAQSPRRQFSATIEDNAPTFYRHNGDGDGPNGSYARIMLPLWGDGEINMILGAVTYAIK